MSLSDLAALGSFVSGFAVLASLIYLAIQVRQNTRNVRAQNAVAHFQMVAHVSELSADPRFLNALEKGFRGDINMERDEFLQFAHLTRSSMTSVYTDWLFDRETLLHRGTYSSGQSLWARYPMARPGMRAWWKTYGTQFAPEFQADINRVLEETRPSDNDLGFEMWKKHAAQELAVAA